MAIGLPNNAYVQRQSEQEAIGKETTSWTVVSEKIKEEPVVTEKTTVQDNEDKLDKEVKKYTDSLIERFLTFITQLFMSFFKAQA